MASVPWRICYRRPAVGLMCGGLIAGLTTPAMAQAGASLADLLPAQGGLGNATDRARVVEGMRRVHAERQNRALTEAARLGLARRRVLPGGRVIELVDWEDGQPRYLATNNVNAAISTGANLLRVAPFSLTGSGVKIGVWDGGSALATHVEFGGRLTVMDGAPVIDHATHVAGTLAASGLDPLARGMASGATIISYDWTSDIAEMTANGASTAADSGKIRLSNHSYNFVAGWTYVGGGVTWEWNGLGTTATGLENDFGTYNTPAREADTLAANLPYYLMFRAAGNDRIDNPVNGSTVALSPGGAAVTYNSASHPAGDSVYRGGFDTIAFSALAKNVITIGSVSDAVSGGLRSSAAASASSFSSWGPTDDGRIKPDLVANGDSLYSTLGGGTTSYGYSSGTSMASPNACGSASLLVNLYSGLYPGQAMRASTLKGLLLHTADDLGQPGPDYKYGWGLMNIQKAADLLQAAYNAPAQAAILENQLSSTVLSRTLPFAWDGVSPLRATLSWTDAAGTATTTSESRTSRLVNNLNLRLISPTGTVHLPYIMPFVGTWTQASMDLPATTGTNNTDNVEQVFIASPTTPGLWQAVVSVPGSLASTQAYALVLSGTAPTSPSVDRITPDSATAGPVPFTLTGNHFLSGAVVQLIKTGQPTVNATVTAVTSTTLSGTINTSGMANGRWDVRVQNPDGRFGTLSAGFGVVDLLWSQNFDTAYSGWAASASTGTSFWAPVTTASQSAPTSWFASGPATKNTDNLVSEPIAIPAGATDLKLGFSHRYNLVSGTDGGVLEFSIDGGSWFSVTTNGAAEAITSGGYNLTLNSSTSSTRNEFAGKPAWSGNSGTAFTPVVVSLLDASKYAGKTLRARWRLATNNSTASPGGWYLDSLKLTGLGPPPNQPPAIASTTATGPFPLAGTSTVLTATASDDGGGTALTYTWLRTSGPAGFPVSFSENGNNAAQQTTATFAAAGSYTFEVTVRDGPGAVSTATIGVMVSATPSALSLSPATVTFAKGTSQVFTASLADQFGAPISRTPSTIWSNTGGGLIDASGTFTANEVGGPFTVRADIGSLTAQASLTITGVPLATWQAQYFTPAEIAAEQHLDAADPDQDGVTNLTEYALGTDPRLASDTISVQNDAAGQWLTFQRPKGLPDVVYQAVTSSDLNEWTPLPLEVLTDGPVQTVRVFNPASPNGRIGFIQVRFTRP